MPGVGASRCESWQLLFVLFVCVPPTRRGRRNHFFRVAVPGYFNFNIKKYRRMGSTGRAINAK